MILRPYQDQGLNDIAAELANDRNRLLLQMATGLGKTVTFAALLRHGLIGAWLERFPADERKMLVIAHREELLDQAAEKITRSNPGVMVSIEQGARNANRYSDVVVASIQTLAAQKFARLRQLQKHHTFRLVVIDEAHHAAAASYRTALVHLGFLPASDASDEDNIEAADDTDAAALAAHLADWDAVAPRDRLLLGVTATPNRSDAVGLGCVFQTIAYAYGLRQAIADGWLVPIKPWVVDTSVDLDGVRTNRGDFNQRELADAVNHPHRNGLAVDAWHKYALGLPTIAFTVDVQHAHDLADTFRARGVRAVAVSGDTPKDQRRAALSEFKRGQIDVLTNCMVLTEGTDLPMAACILHAKPTKSATLYEQMTGRGLRPHPDDPVGPARMRDGSAAFRKPQCVVIDVVDVARKHSLQTAPVLYGLPPGLISSDGKDLQALAEAFEAFTEAHPGVNVEKMGRVAIEQLTVKAATFDIWQVPALGSFAAGRAMRWVKTATDSFRISYPWQDGTEVVTVTPDLLGRFDVVCTFRPGGGPYPYRRQGNFSAPRVAGQPAPVPAAVRQRTIVAGVDTADHAAEIAELYIKNERPDVLRMTDSKARWRRDEASPGQKSWLRWNKIPYREDITKGDAADLINLAKARTAR